MSASRAGWCVFKRKRRRNARVVESRTWWGEYRVPGGNPVRFNTGCVDKRVAREIVGQRLLRAEREAAGLQPSKALVDTAQASLEHLVDEFVRCGGVGGRASARHLRNVRYGLLRLFKECEWRRAREISADGFNRWRQSQGEKASKTLNNTLGNLRAFWGWMRRGGRVEADPLRSVVPDGDRRVKLRRRALTVEEAEKLIAVAQDARPVYVLALLYGLRRGDLRALTWGMVDRSGARWVLRIPAGLTKNREPVTRQLREDAQRELEAVFRGQSDGQRVFRRCLVSPARVRKDLAGAGVPYRDGSGRVVDFHALRHTSVTWAQRTGLSEMALMAHSRHSDRRLLDGPYTDRSQFRAEEVVEKLPRLDASKWTAQWTVEGTENGVSAGREASGGDAGERSGTASQVRFGKAVGRELPREAVVCRGGPEKHGCKESNLEPPDP